MKVLGHLFEQNRLWAERMRAADPAFFTRLAGQQSPHYLWIGCADSRVPANQIVGLNPGEMFVHRNIANVVAADDANCLAVLQYAVDVLGVQHIIVCGHYGCGGVRAALRGDRLGLADAWLEHVREVLRRHPAPAGVEESRSLDRLCELNVVEQVMNVCRTPVVRGAWERQHTLSVHGWIYALQDGLLRDLGICVTAPGEIDAAYRQALAAATTE